LGEPIGAVVSRIPVVSLCPAANILYIRCPMFHSPIHADLSHNAAFSVKGLTRHYPLPPGVPEKTARWIYVSGNGVAICGNKSPNVYSESSPAPGLRDKSRIEYLGERESEIYFAAELPDGAPLPEGRVVSGVRELWGQIPDEDLAIAAYAVRMIDCAKANRFCGRCGTPTEPVLTERAWQCPSCKRIYYPRISPAIIVLIKNGDKVLLARSPRFPKGMYSVIAGFVEPGETLEEALHREVREEVGISVNNIRYFASEPWPFPDSLMIGFTAEYAGGEIGIDNNEIVDADWFGRDNLPQLPARMSISRALIERWICDEP